MFEIAKKKDDIMEVENNGDKRAGEETIDQQLTEINKQIKQVMENTAKKPDPSMMTQALSSNFDDPLKDIKSITGSCSIIPKLKVTKLQRFDRPRIHMKSLEPFNCQLWWVCLSIGVSSNRRLISCFMLHKCLSNERFKDLKEKSTIFCLTYSMFSKWLKLMLFVICFDFLQFLSKSARARELRKC